MKIISVMQVEEKNHLKNKNKIKINANNIVSFNRVAVAV
jgi:hypothetical protein